MAESEASLSQVYDLMDKALKAKKGIKIELESPGMAWKLRHRCYAARLADRKGAAATLPLTDSSYGKSVYDVLKFDINESNNTLSILNKGTEIAAMGIEGIKEI